MKLVLASVALGIFLSCCSAQENEGSEPAVDLIEQLHESQEKWLRSAKESDAAEWRNAKQKGSDARTAFARGEYQAAAKGFADVLKSLEKIERQETLLYGQALSNHADALKKSGAIKDAIAAFRQAIEFNDQLLRRKNKTNATMRFSFSEALTQSGEHEQALETLVEAAEILKGIGKARSSDHATCLMLQSNALRGMGEYEKSVQTGQESVEIIIETGSHRLLPSIQLLMIQSYDAMAEKHKGEASDDRLPGLIASSVFGDDTVQCANWLMTIAKIKRIEKKNKQSLGLFESALEFFHNQPDYEPLPAYQACVEELAKMYKDAEDFGKAITFTEKAMKFAETRTGDNSAIVATHAFQLATLFIQNGDRIKCESLFEQRMGLLADTFGKKSLSYTTAVWIRATNLHQMEKWADAAVQWEEVRRLQPDAEEPLNAQQMKDVLRRQSEAYEKSGSVGKAQIVKEELETLEAGQDNLPTGNN